MFKYSINKISGLILALSPLMIHYYAGIYTNIIMALFILLLFIVLWKEYYTINSIRVIHIIYILPFILYTLYIISPFIGNLIYVGTLYDSNISILEVPFRFILFLYFIMIAKLICSYLLWDYFLKIYSVVYIYFVLKFIWYMYNYNYMIKYTNTSGVFFALGSIYYMIKIRNNLIKYLLFIFTLIFLYYVMKSRTIVIAYIVFNIYYLYSNNIYIFLKKKLLIFITISFIIGIYSFIHMDISSNKTGLMNPVTSGRGAIWEHYINYTVERSPYFGLGHGRGNKILDLVDDYSGALVLLKVVMLNGGAHNSYIYTFSTRGLFGLLMMYLFIHVMLYKRNIIHNKINVGMFLIAALMMFTTGQSSLGGLTIESMLMLMSLTIPYQANINNDNMYIKVYK